MDALFDLPTAQEKANLGKQLLASGGLADDTIQTWEALEAFALALLEVESSPEDAAVRCEVVKRISARFPGSKRARCLLLMEAEKVKGSAVQCAEYTKMAKADPTDTFVRKRRAALLAQLGFRDEAIESLCVYLGDFQGDTAAWKQLADLYNEKDDMERAIYCMEVVLLAQPNHAPSLCAYGDMQLGKGNDGVARKYYCLAAEQCCLLLAQASHERQHARLVRELRVALDSIELCLGESARDGELRAWVERKRASITQ